MKWTVLLLAVFIVQEPVSSNAILLEAYQHGYNVWLIHLLFVIATLFDVVVGYSIGKLFHKRFENSKFAMYARKKMDLFTDMAGKHGKKIAILIFGPIIFPASAIIAPWLAISFSDALIFFFIGDLILWYAVEWLLVLGTKFFIPNPGYALYGILAASLVFVIGTRYIKRRFFNKP